MTITRFGNNRYEGLTADTKPTNVVTGAIFRDTQLDIFYKFNGASWDVIIGNTKTEILTSKTVNLTNNIVTDDSTTVGDILKSNGTKFVRMARGTAGQYLKVNAGATDIGWETDALVINVDDLQDVAITTPVYRGQTIVYDGTNYINSNQGTFHEKTGMWVAGPTDTSGSGLLDTVTVTTPVGGSVTDMNSAVNGHGRKFTSDSSSTASFGISQAVSFYQRRWNCRLRAKISCLSQNSNTRFWIGFTSSTTLPTSSDALVNLSGVLFGIYTLTSGVPNTNFEIVHNSGDGTVTNTDSGMTVTTSASDETAINVEIAMSSSDVKVYGSRGTNPVSLIATLTTDIPATSTVLYPYIVAARNGGSAKQFDIYNVMVGTI